eukprot:gene19066-3863_t
MYRPFLKLLLFLALCDGFTAADVGKCADGSDGLTIAAYTAGDASTATCVPAYAFYRYAGDVVLTGDDCKALARIEEYAFYYMSGKVTIDCALGKLTHVAEKAFYYSPRDASRPTASSINLSGALLLKDIAEMAFYYFKGAIILSGNYPALTDIGRHAFSIASNPGNSISIACSSPDGPLTVGDYAFSGYVGSHDASGEQTPCIPCENKICAAGRYRVGTCGADGRLLACSACDNLQCTGEHEYRTGTCGGETTPTSNAYTCDTHEPCPQDTQYTPSDTTHRTCPSCPSGQHQPGRPAANQDTPPTANGGMFAGIAGGVAVLVAASAFLLCRHKRSTGTDDDVIIGNNNNDNNAAAAALQHAGSANVVQNPAFDHHHHGGGGGSTPPAVCTPYMLDRSVLSNADATLNRPNRVPLSKRLESTPTVSLQLAVSKAAAHCNQRGGGRACDFNAAVKKAEAFGAKLLRGRGRRQQQQQPQPPLPKGLTAGHAATVHVYTQDTPLYKGLNGALGGWGDGGAAASAHYLPYAKLLTAALKRMPRFEGRLFRGVRLAAAGLLDGAGVGDVIELDSIQQYANGVTEVQCHELPPKAPGRRTSEVGGGAAGKGGGPDPLGDFLRGNGESLYEAIYLTPGEDAFAAQSKSSLPSFIYDDISGTVKAKAKSETIEYAVYVSLPTNGGSAVPPDGVYDLPDALPESVVYDLPDALPDSEADARRCARGEASGGRNCTHRALPGQRFCDKHVCSHAGCSTSKSSATAMTAAMCEHLAETVWSST